MNNNKDWECDFVISQRGKKKLKNRQILQPKNKVFRIPLRQKFSICCLCSFKKENCLPICYPLSIHVSIASDDSEKRKRKLNSVIECENYCADNSGKFTDKILQWRRWSDFSKCKRSPASTSRRGNKFQRNIHKSAGEGEKVGHEETGEWTMKTWKAPSFDESCFIVLADIREPVGTRAEVMED